MADSDEEAAQGRDEGGGSLDLTSFLFGNIDTSGQLEEEFLDESTKKQLNSLGTLLSGTNLNSLAREVSIEAEETNEDLEEADFDKKADDAEDYSNIEEMMDDDSSSEEDSDDEDAKIENKSVVNDTNKSSEVNNVKSSSAASDTVAADLKDNSSSFQSQDISTKKTSESDKLLMPPPPPGQRWIQDFFHLIFFYIKPPSPKIKNKQLY